MNEHDLYAVVWDATENNLRVAMLHHALSDARKAYQDNVRCESIVLLVGQEAAMQAAVTLCQVTLAQRERLAA